MAETNTEARNRGYTDGESGVIPTPEDAGNEPYADGYKLGFQVRVTNILKGK
jgi:hypothetical protein